MNDQNKEAELTTSNDQPDHIAADDVTIDDTDSAAPKTPAETDSEEVVEDQDATIARLEQELANAKEKYLRALADMDNLRKRCRRDIEDARVNGRVNILEELLPALDSMDMALKSVAPNEENQAVIDGLKMVQKQFFSSMSRFGLKPLETEGGTFDPAHHEAVSYIPSPDHDAGVVITEMRKGYVLGERLLRAAMVVVSAGAPKSTPESPTGASDEADSDITPAETDVNESAPDNHNGDKGDSGDHEETAQ